MHDATIARYLTIGGADVHVTTRTFRGHNGYLTWTCGGCGETGGANTLGDPWPPNYERSAHTAANEHAGQCRSMPHPA